jgi:hypothetical protein
LTHAPVVWGKTALLLSQTTLITGWQIICPIFQKTTMGSLLYLIAVILVICWAIGFFAYGAGGIIHALLVIAVIVLLLKFIRREA